MLHLFKILHHYKKKRKEKKVGWFKYETPGLKSGPTPALNVEPQVSGLVSQYCLGSDSTPSGTVW